MLVQINRDQFTQLARSYSQSQRFSLAALEEIFDDIESIFSEGEEVTDFVSLLLSYKEFSSLEKAVEELGYASLDELQSSYEVVAKWEEGVLLHAI